MKRSEAALSQIPAADAIKDRFSADWWYVSHLEVQRDSMTKLLSKQARLLEKLTGESIKIRAELKRLKKEGK